VLYCFNIQSRRDNGNGKHRNDYGDDDDEDSMEDDEATDSENGDSDSNAIGKEPKKKRLRTVSNHNNHTMSMLPPTQDRWPITTSTFGLITDSVIIL